AVWYFAYFMNPGVIYSQSLKNTGKGYDKLVTYVDKQEQLAEKGYTGTGNYKVKLGDLSTDGSVAFKSDSENAELTFDVGAAATRVNADIRTFKSSGETPDIYIKAKDIKGLGTVLGIPELDAGLAKIDDSWIVIDHTLIDNLRGATAAETEASSLEGPTREQILDEVRAFGRVNQEYVFSTDEDKAVTKIVKKYGKETVDGHKTYHYQVALQKDNVKKYIYAQRDALKASKLNGWLEQNDYDKTVYDGFEEAAKSTKDIKSTDTFDIWVDTSKRVVYKVRFSEDKNPAANYVDLGLDYEGGDIFPFFLAGKFTEDDVTTFKLDAILDTESGATRFNLDVKNDSEKNGGNVTATLNFKPSEATVKIDKPENAKPLSQALNELGLGDLLGEYSQTAADSGDGRLEVINLD
ncbi:MAG TPA: hypothetical protein VD706_00490, partial [Candidatus Saccharimonadales bacterium]|nr:hypothetical protein [Candidatus Saccharimonadales bacterium]